MFGKVRAWLRGDELVGITLTGLTSCLVSPISWTHHLYWIVPAALVLVDVAAGTSVDGASWSVVGGRPRATALLAGGGALAVMTVFGLSLVWFEAGFNGTLYGSGPFVVLVTGLYALAMLALLVALPTRDRAVEPALSPPRPVRATARQG